MALEEKISKHLGKPYIYLKDQKKFLCSNGVLFTLEEYKNGIDINAEYERRAKEDMLYDYAYAKSTGLLRQKRGYGQSSEQISDNTERSASGDSLHSTKPESLEEVQEERSSGDNAETRTKLDKQEEIKGKIENGNVSDRRAVGFIIALLSFTSLISGYNSTLHTATYL